MAAITSQEAETASVDEQSEIESDDQFEGTELEGTSITREEEHGGEEEITLAKDDIFHILQNERRRQVLRHLQGVEGKVEMREVAEKIAAWENDTTVANLYSDQRQRVYIALYQSHLPKLDDLGVIDYNQSRGTIEPTALLEDVSRYLESDSDRTETGILQHRQSGLVAMSLSVGLLAMVLAGVAQIGLFPLTVPALFAAVLITGAVAGLADRAVT